MERTNIHHPHCDGTHPSGGFGCRVQERPDWEIGFDHLWKSYNDTATFYLPKTRQEFKQFVRNILASDRASLVKSVEGMKKNPVHKYNCPHMEYCVESENERINDALDDVIALLSTKKED